MEKNKNLFIYFILCVNFQNLFGAANSLMMPSPISQQKNIPNKSISTTDEKNYSSEEVFTDAIESKLDTVDVMTSGNWLLKRAWWEKTEDLYEQLKDIVAKVMEMRTNFLSQKNEMDRVIDVCCSEVGLEQGELYDIVGYGKDLLDKQKVEGLLTPEQKAFAEKLTDKERDLDQLKLDIKTVSEIDKKMDDALDLFFSQIDTCTKYEHKAWENFKDIARELDDKEARKLYYSTEALFKDIKNIQQYLETDFLNYFNTLMQTAKTHTQKISTQVNSLKSAGIDLKKEMKILEAQKSPDAKQKNAEKKMLEDKKKMEEEQKKKQEALEKAKWSYPISSTYSAVVKKIKNTFESSSFLNSYMTLLKDSFKQLGSIILNILIDSYNSVKNLVTGAPKDSASKKELKNNEIKKNNSVMTENTVTNKEIDKKEVVKNKDEEKQNIKKQVAEKAKIDVKKIKISSDHESVKEDNQLNNNIKKSDDLLDQQKKEVMNSSDAKEKNKEENELIEYYEKSKDHENPNEDTQFYDLANVPSM